MFTSAIYDTISNDSYDFNSNLEVSVPDNMFKLFKYKKGLNQCLLKLVELRFIVNELKIDCLAVSETWLDSCITNHEINIPHMYLFRNDRNRNGGGTALYVNQNLNPKSLNVPMKTCCTFVKIYCGICTYIVHSVYREPSATAEHYENMLNDFENVSVLNNNPIIMGDFNINYFDNNNKINSKVKTIENLLSVKQIILQPNRVTPNSSTIIDHIYLNDHVEPIFSGILKVTVSDHYAVSVVLKNNNKSSTPKVKIRSRSYKHFNCDNFLHDIVNSPVFLNLFYISDTTCAWNLWKDEFLRISNLHCPIFIKPIRDYSKPWISTEIIKQIHRRNYLHRKALRTKCPADCIRYKHIRKDITSSIRQSKFTYFNEKINSSNNSRNIWKALKEALTHKQHRGPVLLLLLLLLLLITDTVNYRLTTDTEKQLKIGFSRL